MTELTFTSKKYNIPYYYNPISNKTSWDATFEGNNKLIETANAFKPPDVTKDPDNINPNYAVKSQKYGYNYFFNTETKTSKWEIPRTPVDRIMGVILDFDNSLWTEKDSNYDVIMEWLVKYLRTISDDFRIDPPLKIDWVDKARSTVRVRTNLYDALSPNDVNAFYYLLRNIDSNGDHPIYCDLNTNILSFEQPDGEENIDWVLSLVTLKYPQMM